MLQPKKPKSTTCPNGAKPYYQADRCSSRLKGVRSYWKISLPYNKNHIFLQEKNNRGTQNGLDQEAA